MSGTKPRYYWDTCIYLAWLKQEDAYKVHLPAINSIASENKRRNNVIVTSAITLMEVLEYKLDPPQEKQFQDCLRPGAHEFHEVSIPIARKARIYRGHYVANPIDGSKMSFPDAIHLATAKILEVDEFNTFDKGKKDGFSLLKLNGNVAGDALKICVPQDPATASGQMLLIQPTS